MSGPIWICPVENFRAYTSEAKEKHLKKSGHPFEEVEFSIFRGEGKMPHKRSTIRSLKHRLDILQGKS